MTDKQLSINFHFPMFMDQVEPKGRLVLDKRCHACWYYYMLAHKNWSKVGRGPEDQIIVEDSALQKPLWMHHEYHQIATSVATLYGLGDPDEYLRFFELVEQEAARIGYEVPEEIKHPFGVGTGRQKQ